MDERLARSGGEQMFDQTAMSGGGGVVSPSVDELAFEIGRLTALIEELTEMRDHLARVKGRLENLAEAV
jgi:hypothetical protein